jgi:hypothetical protein
MDTTCLRERIGRIIREKIAPGLFFDSHSVILFLDKEYPNEYSAFVRELSDSDFAANGQIGIMISHFEDDLVERQKEGQENFQSWSKNTRENFSVCALWRRIG